MFIHDVWIDKDKKSKGIKKLEHHLDYLIFDYEDIEVWDCHVTDLGDVYQVTFCCDTEEIELDYDEWTIIDESVQEEDEDDFEDTGMSEEDIHNLSNEDMEDMDLYDE